MARTFITADSHFDHTNIIKYCKRPFEDVNQMNQTMVARWNDVVGRDDIVLHLGDLCFRGAQHWFDKLNGQVFLIAGNHDKWLKDKPASERGGYKTRHGKPVFRLPSIHGMVHHRVHVVLSHYAMRAWDRQHHGSYHFFGHSHGNLPNYGRSMDVGVDVHNFAPVLLDDLIKFLEPQMGWRLDG